MIELQSRKGSKPQTIRPKWYSKVTFEHLDSVPADAHIKWDIGFLNTCLCFTVKIGILPALKIALY
jgi:hypothetical protein